MRRKLLAVKREMARRMHRPVPEQGRWLASVLSGHYRYYAVPDNIEALSAFRYRIIQHWLKALRRRSQKHRLDLDADADASLTYGYLNRGFCIPGPSSDSTPEPEGGAQCGSRARWEYARHDQQLGGGSPLWRLMALTTSRGQLLSREAGWEGSRSAKSRP